MQPTIFNTPVIKIDSLKPKFDTLVLSNSFVTVIGDYIEALFFHQLHYWSYSEYGVVIDGTRWIYKPLREWLSEVFTFLTEWKLRKAIASLLEKGLIERKKLYVKHHEIKHDNPYWNPKNQTYYYSVNYDELQKRIERVENAETIENVRIENSTKLSSEEFQDTKCCELSQNKTDLTSIENSSKDRSHPTLPCVCKEKREISQKQELGNPEVLQNQPTPSVEPTVIGQDTNTRQVEQKVNQNINATPDVASVPKPQLKKTPKGTKSKRQSKAPWKDEEQLKRFYRALIQALPIVANSHSPQGLAKTIIAQLKRGEEHTYWDDFVAGLPIGTSTKPEWEVEPGVPYPMFIEYLTEKIIKGNNTQTVEQARNEVFRILDKPRQAKAFWGQFKRSVVNVSEQVERDRSLGVSNPNTPVWTRERIEPSVEEAAEAGQKIMAVNGGDCGASRRHRQKIEGAKTPQLEEKNSAPVSSIPSPQVPPTEDPWSEEDKPSLSMREMLEARGVKGFCPKGYRSAYKPMPKVSQAEIEAALKDTASHKERQQTKPKTNIATMAIAEINEYLTDPILRAELTPQLMQSNYELITDELGQIIKVKLSELQIRERRSQSLGE